MLWSRVIVAVVVGMALALPGGAQAQAMPEDSATGSGNTPSYYHAFEFTATSDPAGGSPSGTASWDQLGVFHFEGSVTCLNVTGNRAVIGIDVDESRSSTTAFPGFFITVIDRSPATAEPDSFDAQPANFVDGSLTVPTDCAVPVPPSLFDNVVNGDIVVRDAPRLPTTGEQCKNGGWRNFGTFKNQGDCASFVATGGRNPPAGAKTP
jgi:hypothetical protein